jgi:large subunit ribosomal protein L21
MAFVDRTGRVINHNMLKFVKYFCIMYPRWRDWIEEVFLMYAVVVTGGKQYRVQEGDVLFVEKMNAEVDSTVEINDVLAVSKENGELVVGKPVVEGAKVVAKVLEQGKAKKVIVFKYKRKKDYRRKQGHRQPFTKIVIEKINA